MIRGLKFDMVKKLAVVIIAMAMLLGDHNVAAEDHIVGGEDGWTRPKSLTAYSSWASAQKFQVGDTLVFNIMGGFHTVALLNKEAFDACNIDNVSMVLTKSPVRVPLESEGVHHFICTVGTHCLKGQKLAVNVIAAGRSPPDNSSTPVPTPAPTTLPVTTPNSAPTFSAFTASVSSSIVASIFLMILV